MFLKRFFRVKITNLGEWKLSRGPHTLSTGMPIYNYQIGPLFFEWTIRPK